MAASQPFRRSSLPLALVGIPPFPAVAIQILRMASNEYARLRELSELIRADAAFSSEILRTANSSLYGLRTEVDSVLQAALLLGLERIKAVVVTAAMKDYLGDLLHAPWVRACWRHNLACAILSEELAAGTMVEEDVAYTAGLVHDIGRLALAVAYAGQYGDFLTSASGLSADLLEVERNLFGVDHCEAGYALASWWDLPESLRRVIAHHHDPLPPHEFDTLTAVQIACQVADALGFDAAQHQPARTYAELLPHIPECDRQRLPANAEELMLRIAEKINSIESPP